MAQGKQPQRNDGCIRVSRVAGRDGESFISPEVQREQIKASGKLRGVEVAAWHEDLDQSGGLVDRPGLDPLLARIESGETEGVIVAKLDRLSRLVVALILSAWQVVLAMPPAALSTLELRERR